MLSSDLQIAYIEIKSSYDAICDQISYGKSDTVKTTVECNRDRIRRAFNVQSLAIDVQAIERPSMFIEYTISVQLNPSELAKLSYCGLRSRSCDWLLAKLSLTHSW